MIEPVLLFPEVFRAIVAEASRAPSVHNVQPTRFRHAVPGEIDILEDPSRRLPTIDPHGRDTRLSLGASCTGVEIALERRGLPVTRVVVTPTDPARIATILFEIDAGNTHINDEWPVATRRTWRGAFSPIDTSSLQRLEQEATCWGAVTSLETEAVSRVADLLDEAILKTTDGRVWRETWEWLRLSEADPRWSRDGLNARALGVGGIEARLAAVVLRPAAFGWARRIGLAQPFLSERKQTQTASAIVALVAPADEDCFHTGRRLYRLWLSLTRAGLAACPMSALLDWTEAREALAREMSVLDPQSIRSVLRVGVVPPGVATEPTPRLPAADLIAP